MKKPRRTKINWPNKEELGQSLAELQSLRRLPLLLRLFLRTRQEHCLTGKKKDYTSLPYSKVQAFSVETAGTFDLDSELVLWFSGLGRVKFEFISKADITGICRMISERVL